MTVATLYDLYKTIAPNRNLPVEGNLAPLAVSGHQWIVLMIGFVISFMVALAVVAWFIPLGARTRLRSVCDLSVIFGHRDVNFTRGAG